MKKTLCLALAIATAALCGCRGPAVKGADSLSVSDATGIVFNGQSASVKGGGAAAAGSVVTISAAGAYVLSGTLSDGQVVVDTGEDAGKVTLFLDGADIACSSDAAIYVRQAKELVISTVKDSENRIVSGQERELTAAEDTASGAAIFSEDDLVFDGEGKLTVIGGINNAVTCKDDLSIKAGTLEITAMNCGLRGSESVTVEGGTVSVVAMNDGLKSTSAEKAGKGFVSIEGGSLAINARGDGISAESELSVSGGTLAIVTERLGDKSCKGIKANTALSITGGEISVTAADHAIHSEATVSVSGGAINAESLEGKAVAAHTDISVTGGTLSLISADDGIETPGSISIGGGEISILSGKDGIKAGAKNSGVGTLTVDGGEISICAGSDGVEAQDKFTVNGGSFLALGTSKRMKGFDPGSLQSRIEGQLSGAAGTAMTVADGGGRTIAQAEKPAKGYNTVLFSSDKLTAGESYTISAGSASLELTAG